MNPVRSKKNSNLYMGGDRSPCEAIFGLKSKKKSCGSRANISQIDGEKADMWQKDEGVNKYNDKY